MLVNFDVPLQAFRTTPDDQFRQNWVIKMKLENTKPSSLIRDIKCMLNFALTIFIKGCTCSLWSRKEMHVQLAVLCQPAVATELRKMQNYREKMSTQAKTLSCPFLRVLYEMIVVFLLWKLTVDLRVLRVYRLEKASLTSQWRDEGAAAMPARATHFREYRHAPDAFCACATTPASFFFSSSNETKWWEWLRGE